MQKELFNSNKPKKSYRALRHEITRAKQDNYCNTLHHPDEKINQLQKVLSEFKGNEELSIIEFFAGQGNLTRFYCDYGDVLANEYKRKVFNKLLENVKDCATVHCNNKNSYLDFHELIALKQVFDVIDLDPYGFPTRFLPDVFLLINSGIMFVTMPKPYVNILNGITQAHLISYFGEHNPSKEVIVEKIALFGLCHWRKVTLIDCVDLKSVWRFAFSVEKVKATDYTGVKNR